jgi:AcrR family transcriptional regulator
MSSNQRARSKRGTASSARGPRADGAKRREIIDAAIVRFGRDGYEDTKWADIARDVGVGPTALYHYFESKQHCLYEIMDAAIADFLGRFRLLTSSTDEPLHALAAVLQDCFALTEHEVLRNRVLVAEQGLLASPRKSPREEHARQTTRTRAHELEFAWASFLAGAMQRGAIREADPRLLTRAILGLYNSIWHWCRPGGSFTLEAIADFFKERVLRLLGVGLDGVIRPQMVA